MNLEIWDIPETTMPPRSRLYQLKPVALGSPFVESITSYILRLAAAHLVPPSLLVAREIAPAFRRETMLLPNGHSDLLSRHLSPALNGHGHTAEELVSVLTSLTAANDLAQTTLLRLRNVVARHDLLRRWQAWCPLCLEEAGPELHYPLLWCLRDLKVCPKHNVALLDHCPGCGKPQLPLPRRGIVGRCVHCSNVLINAEPRRFASDSIEVIQGRHALTIFEAMHSPGFASDSTCFSHNVEWLLRVGCDGSLTRFSNLVRTDRGSIRDWCERKQLPKLHSALAVAEAFGICPAALLGKTLPSDIPMRPKVTNKPRRKLRIHDYAALEQQIRVIVESPEFPPRSLARVCADLQCDQTRIMKLFPALATRLRTRYEEYVTIRKQVRLQIRTSHVRQVVKLIHDNGGYPTHKRVTELLPSEVSFIEPAIRDAYRQILRELGLRK